MIDRTVLTSVGAGEWEIAPSFRHDMRVPARLFADDAMIDSILDDHSVEQLVNVTTLPGIVGAALAMPDIHEGYGFPIGGVAATPWPDGVISPGGIGYDINCGVRLLTSQLSRDDLASRAEDVADDLLRTIPSGTGRGGDLVLSSAELDQVLTLGATWALRQGYATADDLDHIESRGCLDAANPAAVSEVAKRRGLNQLGTLGSGNHFAEVGVVDEVFDVRVARAFGLTPGQVTVVIHTGSRGLGHQVASDYIRLMLEESAGYGIQLPDRQLACLPLSSPDGQRYFAAMSAAANFAWANRQVITHLVRQAWRRTLGPSAGALTLLYDVAHNIAKIEMHTIHGRPRKLIVHRKGATRAFGPGFAELPPALRDIGQPVLVPGSMGTASYVLVGRDLAMEKTFGSACHGAGRVMSRHAAKQRQIGRDLQRELSAAGVIVRSPSVGDLPEEAPYAYKDIDAVVNVLHEAGIATKVARLKPLIVLKG